MEIEGPSEAALKAIADRLGLAWHDAVFGSVTVAYKVEYALPKETSIGEIKHITFDSPMPNWLAQLQR